MAKAMDIALFLSKCGYDKPKNTKPGNMMLQKLLLFANLIHLSEYGELLFNDSDILAFEHGCVVEPVRLRYQNQYCEFETESSQKEFYFNDAESDTLKKTVSIFGSLPAKELSNLNHQFDFWKEAYARSIVNGSPQKNKAIVSRLEMERELYKIDRVLNAFDDNSGLEKVIVKSRTFYFNPNEITMDENTRKYLENLNCEEDNCYTLMVFNGEVMVY